MEISNLYGNFRYVAPYEWLINMDIREYDLKQANISVLNQMNILSDDLYNKLKNSEKMNREVYIGKMIRKNPDIVKAVKSGITEARRLFFQSNNLDDMNVLYIDNDSITTIQPFGYKPIIKYTKFSDYIEFRQKNSYTSFYRLPDMDFLYFNNGSVESFRLKNVDSNRVSSIHKGYFMDLLLSIAYMIQNRQLVDCINIIRDMYNEYVTRSMDIDYYREFNSRSMYKVLNTNAYIYYSDVIPNAADINFIDISYNASILQLFYKILMKEYFRKRK